MSSSTRARALADLGDAADQAVAGRSPPGPCATPSRAAGVDQHAAHEGAAGIGDDARGDVGRPPDRAPACSSSRSAAFSASSWRRDRLPLQQPRVLARAAARSPAAIDSRRSSAASIASATASAGARQRVEHRRERHRRRRRAARSTSERVGLAEQHQRDRRRRPAAASASAGRQRAVTASRTDPRRVLTLSAPHAARSALAATRELRAAALLSG